MTDSQDWGAPPNMPPPAPTSSMPPPAPNFMPPPPSAMPPPVPGTGASSQHPYGGPPPHMHVMQRTALHPGVYLHPDKSLGLAYLLCFFLGFLGVHHFYLGKMGRGIGYLLTFGWFMIGLLVDLFTLPSQVKRVNYERRAGLR
jgi:hypothetical protein